MTPKPVSASAIHDQTAIVFPNDLNSLGTLFGGRVLEMSDRLAAVVAKRHTGRWCVTLGIDSVRFLAPARQSDVLILQASVNRVWRTSLEVGIKVLAETAAATGRRHIASAYFTFVALDDAMKPVEIAPVIPETDEEKRRYEKAEMRRQRRLSQ